MTGSWTLRHWDQRKPSCSQLFVPLDISAFVYSPSRYLVVVSNNSPEPLVCPTHTGVRRVDWPLAAEMKCMSQLVHCTAFLSHSLAREILLGLGMCPRGSSIRMNFRTSSGDAGMKVSSFFCWREQGSLHLLCCISLGAMSKSGMWCIPQQVRQSKEAEKNGTLHLLLELSFI